jgi:hypothetical protein
LDGKEPIGGYFLLNVTTMSVKRDKNGTPKQWQQEVPGQDKEVKFRAEDIIHTHYKKKKGAAFAIPFVVPVLDDISALRQVEDNILRNLYRNVFPFYHVKVGTEAAPADDGEVDAMTATIQEMSTEGGLVTSERVTIQPIAADRIVDAHPYLQHFEERVFTGMGVPATMYGRGATANKSTADSQTKDFVDRCKAFNRLIESDVTEHMVKELLYEGGFDPLENPDDMVFFQFEEIDVDQMIKSRNQAIFEYEHNATTEDEMRIALGLDPIEDQGEERDKMHLAIVTLTQLEVAASLKPTSNSDAAANRVTPKNQHSARAVADVYKDVLNRLQDDIEFQLNEFYDSGRKGDYASELTTRMVVEALINNAYLESVSILKDCTTDDSNYSPGVIAGINHQMFDDIRRNTTEMITTDLEPEDAILQIQTLFDIISGRVELTFNSNSVKRSG